MDYPEHTPQRIWCVCAHRVCGPWVRHKVNPMTYLAKYRDHHQAIGQIPRLPGYWYTCAAWRLMAELARRHPGLMHVVEGHYPAGGTVWFLVESMKESTEVVAALPKWARLNETGHLETFHRHDKGRCPIEDAVDDIDDPRMWTIDPLFSPNLREMVEDMEACLALTPPRETPSTVKSTIGWRVIASALGLTLHTKTPMSVSGMLYDGVSPQTHWLRLFTDIADLEKGLAKEGSYTSNAEIEPEELKKMSALLVLRNLPKPQEKLDESQRAVLVVDIVQGLVHFRNSTVDLMKEFTHHNRDVDALAWDLLQKGRAELG
jgi:hypothetical protein